MRLMVSLHFLTVGMDMLLNCIDIFSATSSFYTLYIPQWKMDLNITENAKNVKVQLSKSASGDLVFTAHTECFKHGM